MKTVDIYVECPHCREVENREFVVGEHFLTCDNCSQGFNVSMMQVVSFAKGVTSIHFDANTCLAEGVQNGVI